MDKLPSENDGKDQRGGGDCPEKKRKISDSTDSDWTVNVTPEDGNDEDEDSIPGTPPMAQSPSLGQSEQQGQDTVKVENGEEGGGVEEVSSTNGATATATEVPQPKRKADGFLIFSVWIPHWDQFLNLETKVIPTSSKKLIKSVVGIIGNVDAGALDFLNWNAKVKRVTCSQEDDCGFGRVLSSPVSFKDGGPNPNGRDYYFVTGGKQFSKAMADIVRKEDILIRFSPKDTDRDPNQSYDFYAVHITSRNLDRSVLSYWQETGGKAFAKETLISRDNDNTWANILTFFTATVKWPLKEAALQPLPISLDFPRQDEEPAENKAGKSSD